MTTRYTTGTRSSMERAVTLIRRELANGFDFVVGVGAIPCALSKYSLSTAKETLGNFMPRIVGKHDGNFVPDAIVEIAPETTVQASEVVVSALARQATGRRI